MAVMGPLWELKARRAVLSAAGLHVVPARRLRSTALVMALLIAFQASWLQRR